MYSHVCKGNEEEMAAELAGRAIAAFQRREAPPAPTPQPAPRGDRGKLLGDLDAMLGPRRLESLRLGLNSNQGGARAKLEL